MSENKLSKFYEYRECEECPQKTEGRETLACPILNFLAEWVNSDKLPATNYALMSKHGLVYTSLQSGAQVLVCHKKGGEEGKFGMIAIF